MMAAIHAANDKNRVYLIESSGRIGQKILVTGNGKCNIGNRCISTEQYYTNNPNRLEGILNTYSMEDSISFFEKMGMLVTHKGDYYYPYSEQASTVLDVFRRKIASLPIEIITEFDVMDIKPIKNGGFLIVSESKDSLKCDKCIICTGGPAGYKKNRKYHIYDILKKLNIKFSKTVPALVGLGTDDSEKKTIQGVRATCEIQLKIDGITKKTEIGEVQFTEYGLSGIPVFQFSRLASYALMNGQNICAVIDFFPGKSKEELTCFLKGRLENSSQEEILEVLTGVLNKKINLALLHHLMIQPSLKVEALPYDFIDNICSLIKEYTMNITYNRDFEFAQVCAGGVLFSELTDNLESKNIPGLFFAGEILDVDGICGGYNLHFAFASGKIAGRSAANADY